MRAVSLLIVGSGFCPILCGGNPRAMLAPDASVGKAENLQSVLYGDARRVHSLREVELYESLNESDKEIAKKVVSGLKTYAQTARYGIRSMGAYTDERIDREIKQLYLCYLFSTLS